MDVTELEAAGLYDSASPNAADRLALLEYLADQGVSLQQMQRAQRSHTLTAVAADAMIRSGAEVTIEAVAAASGLTVEQVRRVLTATGTAVPDGEGPVLVESDVRTFAMFRAGMEVFGEEPTLQFTRVLGVSMARIADAAISLFQVNVQAGLDERAAGELALAQANVAGVAALDVVESAMEGIFRLHFEAAQRRSRLAHFDPDPYGSRRLAVGFVDLVGFTPLVQQLTDLELAALIEEFESRAHAVVTAHDGRVVKHMGDEVMFVSVDPADACEIALGMVDAFGAADARIEPHGAVAFGGLLARGGDYYGPVVNLAARVADVAVPGEILVSGDVEQQAARQPALSFEPAGRRMLKGFEEPVALWSLTRSRPTP